MRAIRVSSLLGSGPTRYDSTVGREGEPEALREPEAGRRSRGIRRRFLFLALPQQEKVFAGAGAQWFQQVRRALLQSVRQVPPRPPQWLTQVSCWVSQLVRQVS